MDDTKQVIDSTCIKVYRSAGGAREGIKSGRWPLARNTKFTRSQMLRAILLTGGEGHDCPLAEWLIRGMKPPRLGDKALRQRRIVRTERSMTGWRT